MWHFLRWRRQAANRRQLIQYLLQREILAAQDISLAKSSHRQSVGLGACDFANIHQVEPRIDIRGKLAVEKVDDDSSGRRGLQVIRAHRCRGIQNYYRLPSPGSLNRFLLS